jgi:predicted Fe-Mo cluster-binding NifX family protein
MKIAISANGNTLESIMDQHFGRAAYLIVADSETMKFEAINNAAAAATGGAGIISAQTVVDRGVETVITGNVGPNAMSVLNAAGIPIFRGAAVSIQQNIENLKKEILKKIDTAVPSHFGMGSAGDVK